MYLYMQLFHLEKSHWSVKPATYLQHTCNMAHDCQTASDKFSNGCRRSDVGWGTVAPQQLWIKSGARDVMQMLSSYMGH